ncbi:MAG: hypothetical protein ACJ0QQ_03270 [Parvicellaceae bacterium]|nr:MAG: Uncharacterised protein [Crocinitomicaceae bacterium]|tara:strand:+ start:2543 stop:3439 length:897 start_codon:yes stop_codon:yes gene_type:complete
MNRVILLLFCLSINHLFAQMINNESGQIFTETPFFNEKYIRSVKLKSITGTISSKKELGAIKSSGKKEAYIFNEKGNLTIHYLSSKTKNKPDTTFTFYEYNLKNENTIFRVSDSYGFYSYSKKYNDLGKLINKTYSREKNASKSKMNFKLEEKYVIFQESYLYENKDSIIEVTTLNSNGRPYQRQIYYYDSFNYLFKIHTRLLISNSTKYEKYTYNDRGFLKSIQYFNNENETPIKELRYDYDEWGNVTFMDEYKDNVRVIHKELLYDPSTLILKTILSQDLVSNLITIIKYKPEFYN